MAEKKFTSQVGYDNLLDYDPVNGIVKYGAYEFFLRDLVKPTKRTVTFDQFKKGNKPSRGAGMLSAMIDPQTEVNDKQLRNQWEKMLGATTFSRSPVRAPVGINRVTSLTQSKREFGTDPLFSPQPQGLAGIAQMAAEKKDKSDYIYRDTRRIDDNTYEIVDYAIPNTVDFVDSIAARSSKIYQRASSNRDILKQNQADSKARRQGAAANRLG